MRSEPRRGSSTDARQTCMRLAGLGLLTLVGAAVASCGSSEQESAPVPLRAPKDVAARGALVYCSDISYPPLEFQEDGALKGSDIEIGRELAKRMDVDADFRNTGFDGILDVLEEGECDAVISGMTDTAERRQRVDFVHYMLVGQSLMVPTANELEIEGLEDLGGRTVAVQAGTINETFLQEQAKQRDWGAKGPLKVCAFDVDTKATAALKSGTVDAYLGDSPVVAYYIGQEALTYSFAGDSINPEPLGIAVRPDDEDLREQIQRGVDSMYEDGTMNEIFEGWKLERFALEQQGANPMP